MAGLRIRNLTKAFGKTAVIDNLSFDASDGEFCILLGPSGCGKTTVLRLIAGLEHQDKGEIFIDKDEVSNLSPKERDIAMVFQSYALYPHLSVYENMSFSLRMKRLPEEYIDRKVKETAGLLDISGLLHRKPKDLSGGQRQRVAIGRAIVRNPRLFLFDEPLSNLDAKLRTAMRVELAKLHQKIRSTVIYVTHDQTEAMTLGQKIVLLNEGIIQQVGPPNELYEKPANQFVAGFIGTPQMNFLEGSLQKADDKLVFRSGTLEFNADTIKAPGKYAGCDAVMGIRPESLVPGEGAIKGTVEFIEHLGAETIIYLSVEAAQLSARVLSGFRCRRGEEIALSLKKSGVHFFHDGRRISEQEG